MEHVHPVRYTIRLEPDLGSFRFSGDVTIRLHADIPRSQIVLNALEIAVWQVEIESGDGAEPCRFSIDPGTERLTVLLPREMSGDIQLHIVYEGRINDRMAGFYRSSYADGDGNKYIAVSQFQESDARRAFPCMDHPGAKAVFHLEMEIAPDLVAISNSPVKEASLLGDGRKRVRFEPTPIMSTYLVFIGVGDFETIQDGKDGRIRAVTVPGRTRNADFGLDFGRKALRFCESYYGIPYPLGKLDLIAVPDFAFGAMENWGAITFRENLLLRYPETTSTAGTERICEVVAHEIVHQWFGNLVTPEDWKYLWLNESFATYFSYGVVAHYHPEWKIWERFLIDDTEAALDRDALIETFPIEIPGGEHVVINTSTAPIIYSKGGSILRQIEGYIGADNFRKGLRRYLQIHAYANASSHHLWEAFEDAAELPVTRMMKSWIDQPGFPLIEVDRKDGQMMLRQSRFTYLPDRPDGLWSIPVNIRLFYRDGREETQQLLLDRPAASLDLDDDVQAFKVNDGQTGFYRVRYLRAADLDSLGELVRDRRLPAIDRWGLETDLFALFRSGTLALDPYLRFIGNFDTEDASLPLASIAAHLFRAYTVLHDAAGEKVRTVGRNLLERILSDIGEAPGSDEPHTVSNLRDQVLWQASLYGSVTARQFAQTQFDILTGGGRIHPDILKSVMQVGAMSGGDRTFEWFDHRLRTCESEQERLAITSAIGWFQEPELVGTVLSYVLESVPDRNKFIPIVSMAANRSAVPRLWEWYLERLSDIEKMHPLLYERVIAAIIPACGIGNEAEVTAFFGAYLEKKPALAGVIRLSLEKLRIDLRIRQQP